jgi:lipopolysaccharide heptosyltransferase I
MPIPQPSRILISKLTAIGDVIHAMPVACALKDRFPNAMVAWAVEGRAGDVLEGHRSIDRLIRLPRRWWKSPVEVHKLRRMLVGLRFDVAIDLQGLTKSALVSRLSGARRRIGFAGAMGREISGWLNNERIEVVSAHVVDRYLELLRPLGIDRPKIRFDAPTSAADNEAMDEFLVSRRLSGRLAVVNPGAGWPSKRWPAERFGEVARHLGQKHGVRSIAVWAGDEERNWAETIAEVASGYATLACDTTLGQLGALCRRAELFVGADTGPLHLAAAVGVPCIGLFGPMSAERNGPYGSRNIALQKVCLQGSSREKRTADNRSMTAISVDEVCQACDELLSRPAEDRHVA